MTDVALGPSRRVDFPGMEETLVDPTPTAVADTAAERAGDDEYTEQELLVEEISIDGMCGVY